MATKKVLEEHNNGWKSVVGEGGQVELVNDAYPAGAAAAQPLDGTLIGLQENGEFVQAQTLMVHVDYVDPNPYQPRKEDDVEAINEIAVSIFRNGLMQIPSARAVDGRFQLAFGHTRHAAFSQLLRLGVPEQGIEPDPRFAMMPLIIRDLTDRQMFEMAAAENIKRRQLNPIELATAMQRYRDEFGASSKEVGELFGVADATVRGSIRLLNLPEPVRQRIAAGEITQGVARKLLSAARIIPGDVSEIGDQIAKGGDPDHLIGYKLGKDKNVVSMWDRWRGDEPRGGAGLWLLTDEFPPENLPELTAKQLAELPGMGTGPGMEPLPKTRVKYYLQTLAADADPGLPARLADENPDDADVIERIALLLRPPACSACPFHVVNSGSYYCGLKACHSRKFKAYAPAELKRVSAEMDIPIYDPEVDGKTFLALNEHGWGEEFERSARLVKQKSPDLRLAAHRSESSHQWTKSYCVRIGLVGEAAQKFIDERKQVSEQRKSDDQAREAKWKTESLHREASHKFWADHHIPALFGSMFEKMDHVAAMCALLNRKIPEGKKAAVLAVLRVELAEMALANAGFAKWNAIWATGPVAVVKHLKKVATTWGVELPADLAAIAKTYEIGAGVSTETDEEKS